MKVRLLSITLSRLRTASGHSGPVVTKTHVFQPGREYCISRDSDSLHGQVRSCRSDSESVCQHKGLDCLHCYCRCCLWLSWGKRIEYSTDQRCVCLQNFLYYIVFTPERQNWSKMDLTNCHPFLHSRYLGTRSMQWKPIRIVRVKGHCWYGYWSEYNCATCIYCRGLLFHSGWDLYMLIEWYIV